MLFVSCAISYAYVHCFPFHHNTLLNEYIFLFQGSQLSCTLIGSIFRHSHERVVSVMADSSQTFLGCLVRRIIILFFNEILFCVFSKDTGKQKSNNRQ